MSLHNILSTQHTLDTRMKRDRMKKVVSALSFYLCSMRQWILLICRWSQLKNPPYYTLKSAALHTATQSNLIWDMATIRHRKLGTQKNPMKSYNLKQKSWEIEGCFNCFRFPSETHIIQVNSHVPDFSISVSSVLQYPLSVDGPILLTVCLGEKRTGKYSKSKLTVSLKAARR